MTFKRSLIALAVLVAPITACEDLLQTEPRTALSPEVVLGDVSGAEAILVSGYNRLIGQGGFGNSLMSAADLMADGMLMTPSASRGSNWYTMQPGATLGFYAYSGVNDANYLINGVPGLEAPAATKNRLLGSAHFLRALNYHLMVRSFGYEPNKALNGWDRGVIIRDKPTLGLTDADFRPRSTVTEVYNLIEADLLQAITLLEGQTSIYYANKAAAQTLLARVYLYWEKWAQAEQMATNALASTSASLLTTAAAYETAWGSFPNPESIFEFNINASTESVGSNESLLSWLSPNGLWFEYWMSQDLVDQFETGDIRASLIKQGTKGGVTGPYLNKWNANKGNFAQNLPVFRLPELYLIRAEARAEQNNLTGALADLNTLRAARNVPAATAANRDAAIAAILKERRVEYAYEGHRFYDLKRRGMTIPKTPGTGIEPIPYSDYRILAMWPQAQVDLNPLLEQNPGY